MIKSLKYNSLISLLPNFSLIFVKSSKEISFINSKSMVQCIYFCLPACGKLRIKGTNE